MIDKIKNLPWMNIAIFGAAAFFGLAILRKLEAINENQTAPVQQQTPLFLSGTGSVYSAGAPGTPPLGGDIWAVPTPDSGNSGAPSDAVIISNNDSQVKMATLQAQMALMQRGMDLLWQPQTNTNNTGNMGPQQLPQSGLISDAALTEAARTPIVGPVQYPPPTKAQAVDFVSQKMSSGDYFGIYDAAAQYGFNATQTAEIITRANEKKGINQVVTASDVNQWTKDRGLATLQ